MNPLQVAKILQLLSQAIPNPKTELNYSSNFELLIAVILSAHATDKSVNLATAKLFPLANTPASLLAFGELNLKQCIKNVGLYNTKAANIIKSCKILVEQHHSNVPSTRAELEQLPGVGRKTANVILNMVFGQPTIAVDTHIFRVANRTTMARGTTPLAVEKALLAVIPQKFLFSAHHLLLLHGRYVCRAKAPLCASCVIQGLCECELKNL